MKIALRDAIEPIYTCFLYFYSIVVCQRPEASDVKGLQYVCCVGWETDWEDVVVMTKSQKIPSQVARMAIHDQEPGMSSTTLNGGRMKNFTHPFVGELVVGVAIWARGKHRTVH